MNRIRATVILFILGGSLFAQDEQLIGDKIESGGFGGPVWKATRLNGEFAFLGGGRGGWIINHTLVIGGGGYGTMADVETGLVDSNGKKLVLRMEYSGFELEYIRHSGKLVHFTAYALFGGGYIRLHEHEPGGLAASDNFFVMDASINAEINVFRWLRVNAGAGYRLAFGIDTEGLGNGDVGGPEAQVTVKFGKF